MNNHTDLNLDEVVYISIIFQSALQGGIFTKLLKFGFETITGPAIY